MDLERFSPPASETKGLAQGTVKTSQAALRATWGQIIAPYPIVGEGYGRAYGFADDSVPDSQQS